MVLRPYVIVADARGPRHKATNESAFDDARIGGAREEPFKTDRYTHTRTHTGQI